MKKHGLWLGLLWLLSPCCQAEWYDMFLEVITKQAGISQGIMNSQLSLEQEMSDTDKSIEKLMHQVSDHMTGHSGYGNYQFRDYQSYGKDAQSWSNVINMAARGHGVGELGQVMTSIAKEFPTNATLYNLGVQDTTAQRYYAAKSQTMLVARAASQLDYNKIQEQIAYQQMLLQQVEKTKDLKSAMDLSNRIQVEGNLIHLEILRQMALQNQQQTMSEQGSMISALSNAKFLTKK